MSILLLKPDCGKADEAHNFEDWGGTCVTTGNSAGDVAGAAVVVTDTAEGGVVCGLV